MMAIPVAGPWLQNEYGPPLERTAMWPWATWGAIQAAGLTMLIVGLVGHDVPVESLTAGPPKITVVPVFSSQYSALSLNIRW